MEGEKDLGAEIGSTLAREKYWEELDDKGRIERLGRAVEAMAYQLSVLMKLVNHDHVAGKIVVPMCEADNVPYFMGHILNRKNEGGL
jgi:hypothetical protein